MVYPPNYPDYLLKLPKGKKELFTAEYARIPEDQRYTERIAYSRYKTRKKDTLKSVAARFSTTPERIAELNHLKSNAKLRSGTLLVPVQSAVAMKPAHKSAPAEAVQTASTGAADKIRYYTIKKGDTLYSLAKRFKVTTAILSAWNNLTVKVALRPGKRIIVAKNSTKDNG